jgi:hypothetical protein
MPLLADESVQWLLEAAELHEKCRECGHRTAMDYCRTCDEFYWIHQPPCAMFTDKHYGHRLTIIPFVGIR